jgi:hypothetical protein
MLALQENGSLTLLSTPFVQSTSEFMIFLDNYRLSICTTHIAIDHAALQTNLLSSYLAVSMEDNSPLRR